MYWRCVPASLAKSCFLIETQTRKTRQHLTTGSTITSTPWLVQHSKSGSCVKQDFSEMTCRHWCKKKKKAPGVCPRRTEKYKVIFVGNSTLLREGRYRDLTSVATWDLQRALSCIRPSPKSRIELVEWVNYLWCLQSWERWLWLKRVCRQGTGVQSSEGLH